jgi:alcohol dehydrogenase (cytochrome c)
MWHNNLYLEVHDNYLICLDARTGKEKWKKEISSFDQQYFSSVAPIVVGDHVLAGTGNDMDAPGFLQSFHPETGERQWIFYTVPMTADDPAVKTWASLDAARHGGGQPWIPGAYDPETRLYMFGTSNPTPAYTTGRGEGDNLYTCSLVAVIVIPARWRGITRRHRTIHMTGIRPRLRYLPTCRSRGARARWS